MKPPTRSRGFSLILSLTMMAGIVMLVVTLSAFITIESRAAKNQQLATRARMNAMVSMRLALAHLQQEAGPDRRSTARADITQPEVIFAYKFRNPMWTGVWRTDRPDAPPSWIVSGRHDLQAGIQSSSLNGLSDYPVDIWTPWQTDYDPNNWSEDEKAARLITLVGPGTASPAEEALTNQPRQRELLEQVTLHRALTETIEVLEKTKQSFKSRELGELRKKLESILQTPSTGELKKDC